ncbi:hypothetical protein EON77_21385, partial [bacterium]
MTKIGRRRAMQAAMQLTGGAALAGCGGDERAESAPLERVRLVRSNWLSAELVQRVAGTLLERELGVGVDFVDVDTIEQWPRLASGEVHASLEIWPENQEESLRAYVDGARSVESLGFLGPLAKVGWFVPTYLLTSHPELATYEGFLNPDNARLFAAPGAGPRGRRE